MNENHKYLNQDAFWTVLRDWFDALAGNLGQRARLRRAKEPFEVFISPAMQRDLRIRLIQAGFPLSNQALERLALGIGVVSHAKALLGEGHFARQLARADKGSQDVRDVRFRRLLAVEDREELYTMLVRLVRYLDGVVHLESLIKGTFWWNEKTRREWAMHYYTVTDAHE
ncbi:type I-E CRISPR-associated protein Cse2/CasB [Desulfonatronum parangueonense]